MKLHRVFVLGDLTSLGDHNNLMKLHQGKFIHLASMKVNGVFVRGEVWEIAGHHLNMLTKQYFAPAKPKLQPAYYRTGNETTTVEVLTFEKP